MFEAILLKTIVPLVITALFGWIGAELRKANKREEEKQIKDTGKEALEIAVAQTQEEFVDFAKAAAEDGKLSRDEKRAAKKLAIDKAIEIAEGDAGRYLIDLSFGMIGGLIDLIVGKNKKK